MPGAATRFWKCQENASLGLLPLSQRLTIPDEQSAHSLKKCFLDSEAVAHSVLLKSQTYRKRPHAVELMWIVSCNTFWFIAFIATYFLACSQKNVAKKARSEKTEADGPSPPTQSCLGNAPQNSGPDQKFAKGLYSNFYTNQAMNRK